MMMSIIIIAVIITLEAVDSKRLEERNGHVFFLASSISESWIINLETRSDPMNSFESKWIRLTLSLIFTGEKKAW